MVENSNRFGVSYQNLIDREIGNFEDEIDELGKFVNGYNTNHLWKTTQNLLDSKMRSFEKTEKNEKFEMNFFW